MGSIFSGPSKPAQLNVAGVASQANAQNTSNAFQQAAFNRVNQKDALGNTLNYNQTGTDANGNPTFTASQQLGETGQMYAGGLAGLGQQFFNTAGQNLPSSTGAFNQAYDTATANLEPRLQRASDAKYNQLRNQGLNPSDEAFKNAQNDLALQQNEARNDLTTKLRGQIFNENLQSRQQQMSELQPGVQFGNTALQGNYANVPGVNVGNVDVAGLNQANQNDLWKGYQADVTRQNAMLGGLAGIGGSLLMAPMTGGTSLGGMIGKGVMNQFTGPTYASNGSFNLNNLGR